VYRGAAGWVSWPDWLGYEEKGMPNGGALPFEEARGIVRALKLGSHKEWEEYSKSGKRPSNIPGAPGQVYRGAGGWISMPDWLGYGGSSAANKKRKKGGASDAAEEDDVSERNSSEEDMEEGEDSDVAGGSGGSSGGGGSGSSSPGPVLKVQPRTQKEVEAFIAVLHQEGVVTEDNCAHLTDAIVQHCRGKTVPVDEIETTPAETLNSDDEDEDKGSTVDAKKWERAYRGETFEVKAETAGGDYEMTQGGLAESMDTMCQRIVITFIDNGSTRDVVDVDTRARQVRFPYVNKRERNKLSFS
jgi:hypothetical protein